MTLKINLSDSLIQELKKGNMKTVNAIKHVLNSNTAIQSDITEVYNTAIKDLYIIDNNKKYYCHHAAIDSILNRIELSF